MTMITPSYLGETIEYSSLHACRSTLEDPTGAYANVEAFTGSIIGKLIVFGYTWALLHHLLSGLRHFVWDLGYGFKAAEREAMTWGALIGGISLTVLVWIVAYAFGGGK